MQKVIRRTHLAKNQAKRKAQKLSDLEHKRDILVYKNQRTEWRNLFATAVRREKQRRRENWELGPLSPWQGINTLTLGQTAERTVGQEAEIGSGAVKSRILEREPQLTEWQRQNVKRLREEGWGVWDTNRLSLPEKPERDKEKECMIRKGDRVAIIEGHENIRGRIGKVTMVDHDSNSVLLEGLNRVDYHSSEALEAAGAGGIRTREAPIPLASVRLVYPVPDSDTGIPRDCILTNLVKRNERFDRFENEKVWDRYLQPQNIRIPWPKKEEPEYQDEEGDTLRIDVDEVSFLPTLLRPPMPMGVIDELRGKFSVFRDRHEDEYVEKKTAEDEKVEAEKELMKAMTPKGVRNIARRGSGRYVTKTGSEEMKPARLKKSLAEMIGAHMATNGMTLDGSTEGKLVKKNLDA